MVNLTQRIMNSNSTKVNTTELLVFLDNLAVWELAEPHCGPDMTHSESLLTLKEI